MTTTGPPQIRVEEVSLTFPDGTHALDDVSVTVSAGELVALVGPSGCGKSTLLRLVAGFEKAGMGAATTSDHALGYVFQDATLLPWRSVLHNVELPGQLTGIPKASRRESARAAIDRVGLSGFERHRPAQLSGRDGDRDVVQGVGAVGEDQRDLVHPDLRKGGRCHVTSSVRWYGSYERPPGRP